MENSELNAVWKKLAEPNSVKFGAFILGDWLGISAGFILFWAYPSIFTFLFASVIVGHFQHGLVILGHDAVHYRICKNHLLNDIIANIFCYFPIGLTVSSYRDFHFPHHRNPFGENDPEIPLRKALGKGFAPPFTVQRGMKLWALSFLGFSLREAFVFTSMMPVGRKKQRLFMYSFLVVVAFLAYRSGLAHYLALWSYSLVTTYISTIRIQGWYEHGLSGMASNRYTIKNGFFRILFPHNVWLHYEHHKYPAISFFDLEKARELDISDRIYSMDEMIDALVDFRIENKAA